MGEGKCVLMDKKVYGSEGGFLLFFSCKRHELTFSLSRVRGLSVPERMWVSVDF